MLVSVTLRNTRERISLQNEQNEFNSGNLKYLWEILVKLYSHKLSKVRLLLKGKIKEGGRFQYVWVISKTEVLTEKFIWVFL